MKYSGLFTKTSKTTPVDETSNNGRLLLQAGFVDKTMAGVYSLLPLGLRVQNKIENIVRKHLKAIGGQEIMMNVLHPKEWWQKTQRWDKIDILFKLDSQTGTQYAVGCSHEEQVVPIAQKFISSYKDLPSLDLQNKVFPMCVYQIQTKFRDELRAKSGLLRGREFKMKDMYDFHQDQESCDNYYQLVKETYFKIFQEIGLSVYAVRASGGIFTQNESHEFQAACEAGEDNILLIEGGDAFNQEVAPAKIPKPNQKQDFKQLQKIKAEGVVGVEALSQFLKIPAQKTTKTLFYQTDKQDMIAVVVRGDYDVNQEKLKAVLKTQTLELASKEIVFQKTGAKIGYAGIINLPKDVAVYFDDSCEGLCNFESGSNQTNYHHINVNFERDLVTPAKFYDFKQAKEGDLHPSFDKPYQKIKVAEVGNIFKLGDKYTKAFDLKYTDKDNQLKYPVMGCHGLGVSRCMAVIAEIYSDPKGLKWPKAVAPFQLHLITHSSPDQELNIKIKDLATKIYTGQISKLAELQLQADQILWDDRPTVGLGQKLKDADLIGCPYQLVISRRSLERGGVELIARQTSESRLIEC